VEVNVVRLRRAADGVRVNGKQYVAFVSETERGQRAARWNAPELRDQRHSTVLYVFAL
jgi:hypothetical protein